MKTYTITEELGCKDGEMRVVAYMVTTHIDGKFNWSERFTSHAEAKSWVEASV